MVRSEPTRGREVENVSGVFEQVVLVLVTAMLRLVWQLVRWAVIFPVISVPVLVCRLAEWRWDSTAASACVVLVLLLFLAWRLLWPAGFRRSVSGRIWVRWRAWSAYQQLCASTCTLHGLTAALNDDVLVPALRRVVIGPSCDVLTVTMLAGQSTV